MSRIPPIRDAEASPGLLAAFRSHTSAYNARITNMKATLGHSPLAFDIYMQWYPLYKEVELILGKRLAYLFAWSISYASDCPLCTTFFRKIIIDGGESPEHLVLTENEQKILSFGSIIAQQKGNVPGELYYEIAKNYSHQQMVILIAFAGQMIATNVFNNAIETEIDDYLNGYLPANQLEK